MSKRRILLAGTLGNALEFYDFTLFGAFASTLANVFFPSEDPMISLLSGWIVFAVGFLMRPFGAALFGYIGDKYGRKKSLTLSLLLMSIPTLIIGTMPGHASVGIIAPICIILCRLLQGICTGGEYNGAAIFSLEHLGKSHLGLVGGFIGGSCVLGALTAMGFAYIATKPGMPDWAWRVPFILGSAVSLLGFYIRKNLTETPEFQKANTNETWEQRLSFLKTVKAYKKLIFVTFVIGALNGILSYTIFGFLNTYLSGFFNVPINDAIFYNLFGLFTMMLASPLFGYALDRIGPHKFMTRACLTIFVSAIPIFLLFQTNNVSCIIMGQLFLGLLAASFIGAQHAFVQELFPVKARFTGIALGFASGMGLCGGFTPYILINILNDTGFLLAPALLLMCGSIVCFIVTRKVKFEMKFAPKQTHFIPKKAA